MLGIGKTSRLLRFLQSQNQLAGQLALFSVVDLAPWPWPRFLALAQVPSLGSGSWPWLRFLALAQVLGLGSGSWPWLRFLALAEVLGLELVCPPSWP